MAWNDPWAIDGLSISALEARRLQSALLAHDADAVSARAGVLNGLAVSVAGLTVTVAAGSAVVTPSVGSNGSYIGVNDAAATLTAAAQDATYARIDRVVLRCYDNAVDGSGQNKLVAEIITGTPAAAPVAPTLPTGRLEIAQLQVPKSGSGSITAVDKRAWTAPLGGPIQVASVGDLPSGANLRPGIVAVIGSGADYAEYMWTGALWKPRVPEWASFAPAWQQLTVGNGTSVGRWIKNGKIVHLNVVLTLGTTSVMTSNPYITLAASGLPVASGTAAGSGVAYSSASGFSILAWSVDDWILSPQGRISATSPWNWQAGNYLRLSLTYEAA